MGVGLGRNDALDRTHVGAILALMRGQSESLATEIPRDIPLVQHLVVKTDDATIAKLGEIRESFRESLARKRAEQRKAFLRMEERERRWALGEN